MAVKLALAGTSEMVIARFIKIMTKIIEPSWVMFVGVIVNRHVRARSWVHSPRPVPAKGPQKMAAYTIPVSVEKLFETHVRELLFLRNHIYASDREFHLFLRNAAACC